MPFTKGQSGNPSGRPRTRQKHAGAIAKAEKRIADRLPLLIDKALELADGVLVEDINPITGTASVYKEKPDLGAIKYLVDRIMGKPVERQEVEGNNDLIIRVVHDDDDSTPPEAPAQQSAPDPA